MKKIKNKKSQTGDTLTWFVAFIIIFFIIVLFISASIIISKQKGVSTINVNADNSNFGNLESQRSLISFLETPIKIDDKNEKTKDLILESLNPYLDDDSIAKKVSDFNNLGNIRPDFDKEFFIAHQAELKDELVLTTSKSILDEFCEDYMLKIPQGIIKKGEKDFLPESDFETTEWKSALIVGWTLWAEIQLPYKGQIIKIKFRELKKC